jgi:acyl-CoA thioesterase
MPCGSIVRSVLKTGTGLRCDLTGLYGGRGIATGDAFSADGTHVATVAQQVLLRYNLRDST